jgi:hypothetical protein
LGECGRWQLLADLAVHESGHAISAVDPFGLARPGKRSLATFEKRRGSAPADRREDPPRPQLSLHGVLIDLAVLHDHDEVLAWIRNPIEVGDRIAVNPR